MHSTHWEDLIPFYVAGSLPRQDRLNFEAHLQGCDHCKQMVNEWRGIAAAVWQNAQESAHGLPPLSQMVIQDVKDTSVQRQLQAKSKANGASLSNILPLPEQEQQSPHFQPFAIPHRKGQPGVKPKRALQIPLTMVAASLVVIAIVGLLVMMSNTPTVNEDEATNIAALSSSVTDTPTMTVTHTLSVTPPDASSFQAQVYATPSVTPTLDDVNNSLFNPTDGLGGGQENSVLDQSLAGNATRITPVYDTTACYAVNTQETIVNIYEFASIRYDIVGQLTPGDRVEVYVVSENGWYQTLRLDDRFPSRGWVDGNLVDLEGICDSLPLPTPTRSTTLTPANQQCLVSSAIGSDVQIYAGPSTTYRVLTSMPVQVTATAQVASDNGWYRVNYTALGVNWLGWVNGVDVNLNFECDNLPVVESDGYIAEAIPTQIQSTPLPTPNQQITVSPEVVQFVAVENTVTPGEEITLRWETRNSQNVWIEFYAPSDNPYGIDYAPIGEYSDLSPTGTITIQVPDDYTEANVAVSLILDSYDNEGRAAGSTILIPVIQD